MTDAHRAPGDQSTAFEVDRLSELERRLAEEPATADGFRFNLRIGERRLAIHVGGRRDVWGDPIESDTSPPGEATTSDTAPGAPVFPDRDDALQSFAVAEIDGGGIGLSDVASGLAELAGIQPELPEWLTAVEPKLRGLALRLDRHWRVADLAVEIDLVGESQFEILPDLLGVGDLSLVLQAHYPFQSERSLFSLCVTGALEGVRGGDTNAQLRTRIILAEDAPRPQLEADEAEREQFANRLAENVAALGKDLFVKGASTDALASSLEQLGENEPSDLGYFSNLRVEGWLDWQTPPEIDVEDENVPTQQDDLKVDAILRPLGLGVERLKETVIDNLRFHYEAQSGNYGFTVGLIGPKDDDVEDFDPELFDDDPARPVPGRAAVLDFGHGIILNRARLDIRGSTARGDMTTEISGLIGIGDGADASHALLRGRYSSAGDALRLEGLWRAAEASVQDPEGDDPKEDAANLLGRFSGNSEVALPAPLDSMKVREMGIVIDTASRSLELDLDAVVSTRLRPGDDPQDLEARIGVDLREEAGVLTWQFDGTLLVGGEDGWEFDLSLMRDQDGATLLAGYQEPANPETPTMGELAKAVGLDGIELDVAVHEALLMMRARGDGSGDDCLLSMDVEGGLDLANLHLPDLPIVNDMGLDAPDKLRLRVAVAYADGKDGTEALARLASEAGYAIPERLSNGLNIRPVLQIGDEMVDFSGTDADRDGIEGSSGQAPTQKQLEDDLARGRGGAPSTSGGRSGIDGGARWVAVQRAFGPVRVNRVGVAFHPADDETGIEIEALLDASIEMTGLTVGLEGLGVRAPLSTFEPTFTLDGLGISYDGGIEIGGALLKTDSGFAGALVAKVRSVSITAEGLFECRDGASSFLAYAIVDYPIGGPAFFFVTGLAAGFGINRAVDPPGVEDVGDFRLIRDLDRESDAGGVDGLAQLAAELPHREGAHFIAVGLTFTSFKTVDSTALLMVRFGERLEFDLLGESVLSSPPQEIGAEPPLAYARVLLDACFIPEEGTLAVVADLAPDSFVMDRRCRLTGGMGLSAWFADQLVAGGSKVRAGDFVLTIGGYHPDFEVPEHYPKVSAVGLHWRVNEHLTIKGSGYFALTPGAVMAGGSLEADWRSGDVRAGFSASADLLIAWRPHHYDVRLRLRLHATVTVHFFGAHTLEFDASARLHVWGPDFAGEADVELSVLGFDVSFSIAFNDSPKLVPALEWQEFCADLLPAPNRILSMAPAGGQIAAKRVDQESEGVPVFDPHEIRMRVEAAVPFTKMRKGEAEPIDPEAPALGVVPCAGMQWSSCLSVTITTGQGKDVSEQFEVAFIKGSVPSAMWGVAKAKHIFGQRFLKPRPINAESLVEDAPVGIEITAKTAVEEQQVYDDKDTIVGDKDEADVIEHTLTLDEERVLRDPDPDGSFIRRPAQARMLRALGFAAHPMIRHEEGMALQTEDAG